MSNPEDTVVYGWNLFIPDYCVDEPDLTPERVEAIKTSWQTVKSGKAQNLELEDGHSPLDCFAAKFYETLFESAPAAMELFPDDMSQEAKKLGQMLDTAISLLDKDVPALVQALQKLAKRHFKYGTLPEHYDPVGAALVKTLQTSLGDEFTSDVATCWVHLYTVIVNVMLPITYDMCSEAPAKPEEPAKEAANDKNSATAGDVLTEQVKDEVMM